MTMSVDKLVDSTQLDADLTSVANAIRTKGGTSADLAFPSGFVSAIEAIETGGGGDYLPTFISRGQLGSYTFLNTSVPDYCFYQSKFESLSLPNLGASNKDAVFREATIGLLNLPALTSCRGNYFDRFSTSNPLVLPELVTCGGSAFQNCAATKLVLPKFVNASGQTAFKAMYYITEMVLPACTTPGNYAFESCTALKAIDFGVLTSIPQGLFNKCTALDTLVLRSQTLVTLTNINAFNNMAGKAVTVYVPSSLVSQYQSATNWTSVTTASLTFAAIEGSQYENAYADGTPIT